MTTKCTDNYNKKVRIEQLTGTDDAHGFVDQSKDANWSKYADAWCRVMSRNGKEFWKVQQVNDTVDYVWWCRYSKQMEQATPDMRMVYDGNVYEILSVIDIDLEHCEIQLQTRRAVL